MAKPAPPPTSPPLEPPSTRDWPEKTATDAAERALRDLEADAAELPAKITAARFAGESELYTELVARSRSIDVELNGARIRRDNAVQALKRRYLAEAKVHQLSHELDQLEQLLADAASLDAALAALDRVHVRERERADRVDSRFATTDGSVVDFWRRHGRSGTTAQAHDLRLTLNEARAELGILLENH